MSDTTVRCRFRFRCTSVKRHIGYGAGEQHTVEFAPQYSNNPDSENRTFWEATPSGKLEFTCVKGDAVKHFQIGSDYYVDVTLAPPTPA